jgi:HlyD family secretion protein
VADRPIEKKQWPFAKVVSFVVACLVVVAFGYVIVASPGNSNLTIDSARISVARVSQGDFKEFIPVVGTVLPTTTVFLDLEEGGLVEKIYITSGNWVNAGDVILTFSNTNVQKNTIDSETRIVESAYRRLEPGKASWRQLPEVS